MLAEFKEQRLIHKRFAFQILLQVRAAQPRGFQACCACMLADSGPCCCC